MFKTFVLLLLLVSQTVAWTVVPTSVSSAPFTTSATALSSSGPDLNDLDNVPILDAKDLEECKKVDDKEWLRGDLDGMDDPINAGWRQTSESMIQSASAACGVEVTGVTWAYALLTLTVPGTVSADEQAALVKAVRNEFEVYDGEDLSVIDCLEKHALTVTTPGSPNVLTTQAAFDAYVGFDVTVATKDPFKSNRVIEGKLVSRDGIEVKVNVKGRTVRVPLDLVKEVRLPKAKKE